jgi:hypothetical protein
MDSQTIEQKFPLYSDATFKSVMLVLGLGTADALEHEKAALLAMPFLPHEYEYLSYNKFWYVKEPVITQRLRKVFGLSYSVIYSEPVVKDFESSVKLQPKDANGKVKGKQSLIRLSEMGTSILNWAGKWYQKGVTSDEPSPLIVYEGVPVTSVTCTIAYIINGLPFSVSNVGSAPLGSLGQSPSDRYENSIKACFTDAYKRASRMLSIGLELLTLENTGSDETSMQLALHKAYPDDVRYWSLPQAKQQLVHDLTDSGLYENADGIRDALEHFKVDTDQLNEEFYEARRLLALHKAES